MTDFQPHQKTQEAGSHFFFFLINNFFRKSQVCDPMVATLAAVPYQQGRITICYSGRMFSCPLGPAGSEVHVQCSTGTAVLCSALQLSMVCCCWETKCQGKGVPFTSYFALKHCWWMDLSKFSHFKWAYCCMCQCGILYNIFLSKSKQIANCTMHKI